MRNGFKSFILDIPPSQEELTHIQSRLRPRPEGRGYVSLATDLNSNQNRNRNSCRQLGKPSGPPNCPPFLQRTWTACFTRFRDCPDSLLLAPPHRGRRSRKPRLHRMARSLGGAGPRAGPLSRAPQWNNIVVDFALSWLGPLLGFAAADKIVVSACVLTFFWGAFVFIAASTRRIPWAVAPAIAIVTYGFTFYAGFMNFYLSVGLAFFAVAITWRGARSDWLIGAILAAISLVAHPMGFGLLVALADLYPRCRIRPDVLYRWLVLVAASLLASSRSILRCRIFFMSSPGAAPKPLAMNGVRSDWFFFGHAYIYLALATFIIRLFRISWSRPVRPITIEKTSRNAFALRSSSGSIFLIAATMVPGARLASGIHRSRSARSTAA